MRFIKHRFHISFVFIFGIFFSVLFNQGYSLSTLEEPSRIYFLHIPKTGGSTFYSLLSTHYFENQISRQDQFDNPSKFFITNHRYYFKIQEPLKMHRWKILTMLRDPLQRALSTLRFINYKAEKTPQQSFVVKDSFWREFFQQSNIYCKVLSQLNPNDPTISIDEHLESAKKTLKENVFFILILEKLEESIQLLYQKLNLGWIVPPKIPYTNSTVHWYQEYPASLIEEILQNNQADIELYQFALDLYEQQKKDISTSSITQTRSFTPTSEILYTFDQPFMGYGWCERQLDNTQENPTYFRWIEHAENASIFFPLQQGIDYELRCSLWLNESVEHLLRISINGQPIQYILKPQNAQWKLLIGSIPQSFIQEGLSLISFEILDPTRPFQLDAYRGRLGVRSIDIRPMPQYCVKRKGGRCYRGEIKP